VAILLDTHAALWYALGHSQLSVAARKAIENETEGRFVSAVSYWELAIKIQLGNYTLHVPFEEFWKDAIERCGYSVLPIHIQHAGRVSTLPLIHRDPFDRMLVAQALCEKYSLVSNDSRLDSYGVERIW
jgi:PIN domain nuclease of toxin-antitoxin system